LSFRLRHIARNVIWNWIATATSMLVAFFLSPFIVHRLGNTAYGIWILILSTINYLNLADLGMRVSVLRFVSKGFAQQDHESSTRMFSAALCIRIWISTGIVIVSIILSIWFPYFFTIPPEMQRDSQLAVLIVGLTTAMSMLIGVFGGVVSALNRYDVQSWIALTQALVRAAGIVILLNRGHGILAVATWELVAALASNALLVFSSHKLYPQLRIRLSRPERQTISQLWSYSFYAFVASLAIQLIYFTDNVVVGAMVSTTAVAYYSIASSLCRYTEQMVKALTGTLMPVASMLDAEGRTSGIRKLLTQGTQATLALALPVCITLWVRGRTFIGLWMGAEYAQGSTLLLQILIVPVLWSMASAVAWSIALGTEKHKPAAFIAAAEGVANLLFSVILAHWYGSLGVALGTLIPSFVIHMIIWPVYISRLTDVQPSELIGRVWLPIVLCGVPYGVLTYAVDRYLHPHNLLTFFGQTLLLLPLFIAPSLFAMRRSLLPLVKHKFQIAGAA
jgi:O-antigen/teichoic acid export membrane protein